MARQGQFVRISKVRTCTHQMMIPATVLGCPCPPSFANNPECVVVCWLTPILRAQKVVEDGKILVVFVREWDEMIPWYEPVGDGLVCCRKNGRRVGRCARISRILMTEKKETWRPDVDGLLTKCGRLDDGTTCP